MRAKVLGVLRDYGGLAFTLKRSRSLLATTSVVSAGYQMGGSEKTRAMCHTTADPDRGGRN
jgi:primosomal protein N' (replication factor Y)